MVQRTRLILLINSCFYFFNFIVERNCTLIDEMIDYPGDNLCHGSACNISLSHQGMERSTTSDDYKMGSLYLHMWVSVWVACS